MDAARRCVCLPPFASRARKLRIRRDPTTGDVTLSAKPRSFDRFFAALTKTETPDDFLSPGERRQEETERDPFEGWEE